MKETLKRIKADVILSALLCVALGVVLIIWSDETISAICMLLAFGLIVMGVVNLVGYFTNHRLTSFNGMLGLILVLVGIWLFARPECYDHSNRYRCYAGSPWDQRYQNGF